MADLQDTNAATEKIYEPLLIVDCPVSNEMISQSSRRMAASTRKSSLSRPGALLINQISLVEASSKTAPGKRNVDCEYDKNGKTKKCKRKAKLLKRIRGVEKSGKIFLACKIRILCG